MPRRIELLDPAITSLERDRARPRGAGLKFEQIGHAAGRLARSSRKKAFRSAAGRGIGEAAEAAAVGELARGADEPAPGGARQRSADADAPRAERGDVLHA